MRHAEIATLDVDAYFDPKTSGAIRAAALSRATERSSGRLVERRSQGVNGDEFVLPRPRFLYPGWRLRMHQLVDTPAPFKRRNIYGGDRILSRV